jgi:hypothetical protein
VVAEEADLVGDEVEEIRAHRHPDETVEMASAAQP